MKITNKKRRALETLRDLQGKSKIGIVPLSQLSNAIPEQSINAVRMLLYGLEELGLVERPITGGYKLSVLGELKLQEAVVTK